MDWILGIYKRLPRDVKRRIKQAWFELLSRIDSGDDVLFLNHGYADAVQPASGIDLLPADEPNRYAIQLYHRVASAIDWKGLRGLEVSCGRGGGTSYVQRYLGPESLVGLDITANAIRFCEQRYDVPGLSFERGAAEALPFPDAAFDVVLNVESSVLYADVEGFFREAYRVLKPGGVLLYGDYRKKRAIGKMRRRVARSDFEAELEEDITAEVLTAMELEADAKLELVERHAPRLLRRLFTRFAGASGEGEAEIDLYRRGERVWLRFVLRKPSDR